MPCRRLLPLAHTLTSRYSEAELSFLCETFQVRPRNRLRCSSASPNRVLNLPDLTECFAGRLAEATSSRPHSRASAVGAEEVSPALEPSECEGGRLGSV